MADRHHTDTYIASFQAFLTHTDEKQVFRDILTQKFRAFGVHSVLDIGAGNGDLSFPLSKLVPEYEAVEQNHKYVERLRDGGISVYEGSFPNVSIKGKYDLVLSSHSSPWTAVQHQPFIASAWERVAPGGTLLVITYDDEKGEWFDFREACGLPYEHVVRHRLNDLADFLARLGTLTSQTVTTFVRTKTFKELQQALAFVYSDGDEAKLRDFFESDEVVTYLEAHQKDGDGYFFPFNHLVLQVR